MIDSGSINIPPQYDYEKVPFAITQKRDEIVATSAQDALVANFILVQEGQTGAPTVYIVVNGSEGTPDVGSASIASQLKKIKDSFGLNLSQLSKILNVSRPQLYKWLEGEAIPQRDEFNQKITEVFSLINEIPFEHSKYIGKLAKRYTPDGVTVLDALAASELDRDRLLAVYESIRSDIESIVARKANELDKGQKYGALEVILPPNDTTT